MLTSVTSGWTPVPRARGLRRVGADDPSSELDLHTESDRRVVVTLVRGACEAVVTRERQARDLERVGPQRTSTGAQRARTRVRRYVVANGLDRMVTATIRADGLPASGAIRAVRRTLRSIRRSEGKGPYVYVIEGGTARPDHVRVHAHVLLREAWVEAFEDRWELGFTNVRRLQGVAGMRSLANYVAKDFDVELAAGVNKRYEVGRGFEPIVERLYVPSLDEAHAALTAHLGRQTRVEAVHETPFVQCFRWG